MLIPDKKQFLKGFIMALLFFGVFIFMFTPSFGGLNAFDASDKLFNSIAKGSTNYIELLQKESAPFKGNKVDITIELEESQYNEDAVKILTTAGLEASAAGEKIAVKGTLGAMTDAAIKDSEDMFYNRGDAVKGRYDIEEKEEKG